jgi:hypothetical protein
LRETLRLVGTKRADHSSLQSKRSYVLRQS